MTPVLIKSNPITEQEARPEAGANIPGLLASTCVVIPALNEEAALPGVLRGLQAVGLKRIRVVDNGSSDATAAVAAAAGAEVLTEPVRGYGAACWTGIRDLPGDVAWILFCDADGSDDPDDLLRLYAAAEEGADFVLGDRRATVPGRGALTPVQNFGNALATALIAIGWGHRYHDLGPLRLIRREALERIGMRDRGFGWTVEMQVRAVEENLRIEEIPVSYRPRQGGRSKISGTLMGSARAGWVILSTLARLAARRIFVPR